MNRLLWVRPLLKNHTYTIQRGLAKGLRRKGGLSFIPGSKTLSAEDAFLQSLDLSGKVVYDIGAFEGVFTLFFAQAVGPEGRVFTFEANPLNYSRTLENVALNRFAHVQVIHTALGDEPGKLKLMFSPVEAGSGSLHNEVQKTLHHGDNTRQVEVSVDTLDHQREVLNLPLPDFVKLDVEGFEPRVLQGMEQLLAKSHPDFFIELHGFMMSAERDRYWQNLINPLVSRGYSIRHIESNQAVSLEMENPPLGGHLYCQRRR